MQMIEEEASVSEAPKDELYRKWSFVCNVRDVDVENLQRRIRVWQSVVEPLRKNGRRPTISAEEVPIEARAYYKRAQEVPEEVALDTNVTEGRGARTGVRITDTSRNLFTSLFGEYVGSLKMVRALAMQLERSDAYGYHIQGCLVFDQPVRQRFVRSLTSGSAVGQSRLSELQLLEYVSKLRSRVGQSHIALGVYGASSPVAVGLESALELIRNGGSYGEVVERFPVITQRYGRVIGEYFQLFGKERDGVCPLFYLWGPGGTGKSTTLSNVLRWFFPKRAICNAYGLKWMPEYFGEDVLVFSDLGSATLQEASGQRAVDPGKIIVRLCDEGEFTGEKKGTTHRVTARIVFVASNERLPQLVGWGTCVDACRETITAIQSRTAGAFAFTDFVVPGSEPPKRNDFICTLAEYLLEQDWYRSGYPEYYSRVEEFKRRNRGNWETYLVQQRNEVLGPDAKIFNRFGHDDKLFDLSTYDLPEPQLPAEKRPRYGDAREGENQAAAL